MLPSVKHPAGRLTEARTAVSELPSEPVCVCRVNFTASSERKRVLGGGPTFGLSLCLSLHIALVPLASPAFGAVLRRERSPQAGLATCEGTTARGVCWGLAGTCAERSWVAWRRLTRALASCLPVEAGAGRGRVAGMRTGSAQAVSGALGVGR